MNSPSSRRRFLQLVALASGGGLLAACSPSAAPTSTAAPAKPTSAPTTTAPVATSVPVPTPTLAPPPPTARPGVAVGKDSPAIQALYEAAKKEGKVVWWDSSDTGVAQKFMDAFKAQFPGIETEYFLSAQDVRAQRVIQEFRAGSVSFDFIDSGGVYVDYQRAGIYTAETNYTDLLVSAGVDPQFIVDGTYSPEFNVYGVAYNTDLVKAEELPDTLDGFADPKWKGKLAVETRLRNYVYGTPFLGGEEKVLDMLRRLKENNPRPTNGDAASQALLMAGEFPVLIGAYLQRVILMKGKPWGYVPLKEVYTNSPRQGYFIPKGAPHPNAGKLYLWWYMGPEGQAITDSDRFKGNPAAGTGTAPSKYLEEHHMTVKFSPNEYDENYQTYLKKYLDALGMPTT